MKVLIISDSHGHVVNLKTVMEIAKKSGFKAVIHAGDWNTVETVNAVVSAETPFYTVLGNADVRQEVVRKLRAESEKFDEKFLIIDLGGRKVGITHKPSDNKKYFADKKLDIIFNGHLHSKYESSQMLVKIVRPGALIKGINFAVYETTNNEVKFVEDVEK